MISSTKGTILSRSERARGYRDSRNYIAMIYMNAGKLNFELPTERVARG